MWTDIWKDLRNFRDNGDRCSSRSVFPSPDPYGILLQLMTIITKICKIIAADSITSHEKHLSRSISLSVSLFNNGIGYFWKGFSCFSASWLKRMVHAIIYNTFQIVYSINPTGNRVINTRPRCISDHFFSIRILHWKLFRCCGWTSSWTLLHPWLWPQNLRLKRCSWENHMAATSPSSPAPWPRTSWAMAFTSLLSFLVCCLSVCLFHILLWLFLKGNASCKCLL